MLVRTSSWCAIARHLETCACLWLIRALPVSYIDAQTALEWGLVNSVHPHDRLLADAKKLAHDIAKNSPEMVADLKSLMVDG